MHTYIHTHKYVHINIRTCAHILTYIHTCVRTHKHTYIHRITKYVHTPRELHLVHDKSSRNTHTANAHRYTNASHGHMHADISVQRADSRTTTKKPTTRHTHAHTQQTRRTHMYTHRHTVHRANTTRPHRNTPQRTQQQLTDTSDAFGFLRKGHTAPLIDNLPHFLLVQRQQRSSRGCRAACISQRSRLLESDHLFFLRKGDRAVLLRWQGVRRFVVESLLLDFELGLQLEQRLGVNGLLGRGGRTGSGRSI